ncbi:hypothetical protein NG899_19870 [Acidovorax kalamii]|nr:hypothetical protein [Acidovorax kalamii]MCO5357995.1 hypothetical protein [Acidovorax kalamii]
MATPPKAPPRFVPTLTEVVQVPGTPPAAMPVEPHARTTVMPPPHSTASLDMRQPAGTALPSAPRSARPLAAASAGGAVGASPSTARAQTPAPQQRMPSAAAPLPGAMPMARAEAAPALARPMPEGMEEYMVHRVMQRVDVVLDQRLREAIATVVQEQTRSVLPRLREEIESVVRHAVYEAVAEELASGAPTASKG